MARPQRLFLPGHPHHVVQRGHNGGPIFLDDADRGRYLSHLKAVAREYRLAIHAYVLLDDRVHLLLTPETEIGISRMMQALGRRYVAEFNRRHARSGTLWEGRFASHLVDADALLGCQCFIEWSPVQAGLVQEPAQYRWSSAAHHLGSLGDPLVTDHRTVWALGNTPFEREAAYRQLLERGVSAQEREDIQRALRHGLLLGSQAARIRLEHELRRPLAPRPRGRPRARVDRLYDSGTN